MPRVGPKPSPCFGRRDRGPADRHRLRDRRRARRRPAGSSACSRTKGGPPDKGIMLLLADAAQARRSSAVSEATAAAARGRVLARRPDASSCTATRVRLPDVLTDGARTIGLGSPITRAASPRGGRRTDPDDVGEPQRRRQTRDANGDRPARRAGRPRPRWRPGTAGPGVDRRRLHRNIARVLRVGAMPGTTRSEALPAAASRAARTIAHGGPVRRSLQSGRRGASVGR